MKNIYLQIPLKQPHVSQMVLATVTGTSGSTPQKPGSSALFGQTGLISGTVGGGVLEGKVQQIAKNYLISKESGHFLFRLDNSVSNGEDALCGGKISILIDTNLSNHISAFEGIKKSFAARIPGVLITMITNLTGERVLIDRYWMTSDVKPPIPPEYFSKIEPEIRSMLSASNPSDYREMKLSIPGEETAALCFLEPVIPSSRLVIAGAGHIGKALAHIGQMLDFEVTVIDDRAEYANHENIPEADQIITGDIGNAIGKFEKQEDTFIVIVTRGHRDDASALRECIGSDAAYIGMIGSKNKIALMHDDFIGKGWATQQQWERIYAPVGLDIKSKTVEEIAISIAAQLVLARNSRK